MKIKLLLSLVAGCLVTLAVQNVFADDRAITSVPMSTVLQNLQSQGIIVVQKIELDDGAYKVKAVNAQGQMMKLRVNPQTGTLIKPTTVQNHLTMLQAVKAVEAAGYHNVYKVESDDSEYKMKALDAKGSQAEIEVNANSGKISKKWFD